MADPINHADDLDGHHLVSIFGSIWAWFLARTG